MSHSEPVTGGCICGGVRYQVTERCKLRPVIACHCEQCRRFSGHFIAASGTQYQYFSLLNEASLRWYSYLPDIKQGFCGECGCSLFFDYPKEQRISIAAGSLDETQGLALAGQIYCEEAGDYYHLHAEGEMAEAGGFSVACPT